MAPELRECDTRRKSNHEMRRGPKLYNYESFQTQTSE